MWSVREQNNTCWSAIVLEWVDSVRIMRMLASSAEVRGFGGKKECWEGGRGERGKEGGEGEGEGGGRGGEGGRGGRERGGEGGKDEV